MTSPWIKLTLTDAGESQDVEIGLHKENIVIVLTGEKGKKAYVNIYTAGTVSIMREGADEPEYFYDLLNPEAD